jgi:hypothetical protein
MTKFAIITQSHTKRATAAALAEAKARNRWSNSDAADALGCGEGTIRNRLDADDPKNQMTVHELRRSLQADGPHIANAILSDVGFGVVSTECDSAPDALAVAGASARCAAEIISMAPGGFDPDEARRLLPIVTAQKCELAALETMLRKVLSDDRDKLS